MQELTYCLTLFIGIEFVFMLIQVILQLQKFQKASSDLPKRTDKKPNNNGESKPGIADSFSIEEHRMNTCRVLHAV